MTNETEIHVFTDHVLKLQHQLN